MANEEHLAILRQGVEVWNKWRRAHRQVRPDLRAADFKAILRATRIRRVRIDSARVGNVELRGVDLRYADFSEADLYQVDLYQADLRYADLRQTDLYQADLYQADLRYADLTRANLTGADLTRANLSGSNFIGTNLSRTNLQGAGLLETNINGANLQGANCSEAIFNATTVTAVDLRDVQGLATALHFGPSSIGIDTLYASSGEIPDAFLRGCGVPDSMIEYARSLVTAALPIDYYSCFISYADEDRALAERLYVDLQARGVRCWFAPHDLTPGSYMVRGIDEAIRLHDKVVLLLSEDAIKSHWVLHELTTAQTREAREGRIVLYPVRLDDSVLTTSQRWAADLRDARHIGDFRQWKDHDAYQQAFARLLRDLRSERTARP